MKSFTEFFIKPKDQFLHSISVECDGCGRAESCRAWWSYLQNSRCSLFLYVSVEMVFQGASDAITHLVCVSNLFLIRLANWRKASRAGTASLDVSLSPVFRAASSIRDPEKRGQIH